VAGKLIIVALRLADGAFLRIKGRDAWALLELVQAGSSGCTPLDNPGPRWAAYVHNLRKRYGFDVETRREHHRGPFPGCYARYVLLSQIEIVRCSGQQEGSAE
jgi:hypothetical protein